MDDKKVATFERLAEKRVTKVLNDLRLVGNLAGSNYHYTQDHIDRIVESIRAGLEDVEFRFAEPTKAESVAFSFEPPDEDEPVDDDPVDEPDEDDDEDGIETVEHDDETG